MGYVRAGHEERIFIQMMFCSVQNHRAAAIWDVVNFVAALTVGVHGNHAVKLLKHNILRDEPAASHVK